LVLTVEWFRLWIVYALIVGVVMWRGTHSHTVCLSVHCVSVSGLLEGAESW